MRDPESSEPDEMSAQQLAQLRADHARWRGKRVLVREAFAPQLFGSIEEVVEVTFDDPVEVIITDEDLNEGEYVNDFPFSGTAEVCYPADDASGTGWKILYIRGPSYDRDGEVTYPEWWRE
jgi:hypothetical protein